MGKWLGGTPQRLVLYERDGDTLALPFGCLRELLPLIGNEEIECDFLDYRRVDYHCNVPLFDYQEPAVDELVRQKFGILESPAGSGKTQMGVALIARLGCKTLWLTHTADLLRQSMERAAMYMDPALFGTITAGKGDITMTTYYTSYVNHILRFYTRIPEDAEPRFRTDADRLNYEAAHKVFCTLKDDERTALRTVFGARSDRSAGRMRQPTAEDLADAVRASGLSADEIYILASRTTAKIARERGLV